MITMPRRPSRDMAVIVVALGIVVWALVMALHHRGDVSVADLGLFASFAGWVGIGGVLDVRLPFGGLVVCPVAAAAAGSMAMITGWPKLLTWDHPEWHVADFGVEFVVLTVAVGVALSVLLSWRFFPVDVELPQRVGLIISALLSAILFRSLYQASDSLWHMMAIALLVSMVPGLIWLIGASTLVVGRLPDNGREAFTAIAPVFAATMGTTTAIAFGVHALGVLAPPLLASPLLLMRYAMQRRDRQRTIRYQTVIALSRLTEVAGYNRAGHSRQVAQLCRGVGERLGMTEGSLRVLEEAALLHDIGQVSLDRPIPDGATTEAAPIDQHAIATSGGAIVRRTGHMAAVARLLDEQATPYYVRVTDGSEIPIGSRIIKVCNAYVDYLAGEPGRHALAVERLYLGIGYEYDPDVIDALMAELGGEVPTQ